MTPNRAGRVDKIQIIRIYLKHHNDPSGKYQPRTRVCETNTERGFVGCGQTVHRYVTYPNEKGMLLDGPPIVVQETALGNGAIIAEIKTDNVHFATCPARARKPRPEATPAADDKTRAAGERP